MAGGDVIETSSKALNGHLDNLDSYIQSLSSSGIELKTEVFDKGREIFSRHHLQLEEKLDSVRDLMKNHAHHVQLINYDNDLIYHRCRVNGTMPFK